MNSASPCSERRRNQRVKIKVAAFVLKDGKLHGSYHIENLSVGGVKLVGRAPIRKGESVEVLLQLAGRPSLRIPSRGVHCEGPAPFEYSIGLEFDHGSQDTKNVLQEVVVSELERSGAQYTVPSVP